MTEDRQRGKPNKAVVIVPPPAPIASVDKGPEKRIKAIQKKLKQIGDIKMKIAAGEIVELTQVQKLSTEAALQQEVCNCDHALLFVRLTYFSYQLESLTADAS